MDDETTVGGEMEETTPAEAPAMEEGMEAEAPAATEETGEEAA